MTNIAINGFGRIGRLFFRQIWGRKEFKIVAINDLGSVENVAYVLKYDSVYRTFSEEVSVKAGNLVVGGREIAFLQIKDSKELPWKKFGVQVVVESSGAYESFESARAHLNQGAKRVVISAPAKDAEGIADGRTVLVGINDGKLSSLRLTSNGSCTTNAVAPVIAVLSEEPGIEKAILNTVHAYTATQGIVDGPVRGSDFRRGRAGAQNMAPSSTGAAIAVTRVLPDLQGKFDGIAIRVPIIAGSIADITFVAKRKTSVEEVNKILTDAASSSKWEGMLKVTNEQIVSSDIIGEECGAIIDLNSTKVVDGTLVKVLSWYDNEWGYVATLVEHVARAVK